MIVEFRAKCPHHQTERLLLGPFRLDSNADFDAAEILIDAGTPLKAKCPECDTVELVALFVDGKQAEDWMDADEMERRFGPSAGPLPPKPDLDR